MKNRFLCALLFLALSGSLANAVQACSCFAVYSQYPVYGMNFDYPPVDLPFYAPLVARFGQVALLAAGVLAALIAFFVFGFIVRKARG